MQLLGHPGTTPGYRLALVDFTSIIFGIIYHCEHNFQRLPEKSLERKIVAVSRSGTNGKTTELSEAELELDRIYHAEPEG